MNKDLTGLRACATIKVRHHRRYAMYAHYVSTTKRKLVIISREIQGRDHVKTVEVSGKREARKIAAENNATPWNF